jgi:hypothetical protein
LLSRKNSAKTLTTAQKFKSRESLQSEEAEAASHSAALQRPKLVEGPA